MALTPIGIAIDVITRTVGPIGQVVFGAIALFALAVFLGYDPIGMITGFAESWIRGVVGI